MQVDAIPKGYGRTRRLDGAEGIDFVRCLIFGKHLRVISGRHLSTRRQETVFMSGVQDAVPICLLRITGTSRSNIQGTWQDRYGSWQTAAAVCDLTAEWEDMELTLNFTCSVARATRA